MESIPFSVLTYNIRKFSSRVQPSTVLDRIFGLDPQPDLIGFQEVFNTGFFGVFRNARKILTEALEARGYQTRFLRTSGLPIPLFRDGLLAAVKSDRWKVRDFDAARLGNRRAGRYIQFLSIESSRTRQRLALFNTHLSFGTSEGKRALREEQGRNAVAFINRVEAQHGPVASILVGDFNEERPRLDDVLHGALNNRFVDTWEQVHIGREPELRVTFDLENSIVRRKSGPPEASRRIDYVFLSSRTLEDGKRAATVKGSSIVLADKERIEFTQAVFDPRRRGAVFVTETLEENLSDHYGVLTELELRRSAGPPDDRS